MNASVSRLPPDTALAILKISGLRLALPQKEMRALEAADDVDMNGAESPAVGWIRHGAQRWPVYSLSQDLSLLAEIPPERRACIVLDAGAGHAGLLCDDVAIGQEGLWHEVPPAMRLPETPVLGLMAEGQGVVCVTSAERLVAHLARLRGA